jgi:hypothetical protein
MLLIASDAAGNLNARTFTIIRSNRYRAVITWPVFGQFATTPSTIVSGYVSAVMDAGSPTETTIIGVEVNGVAAVMDWAHKDANGNVPFATTNRIPLGQPITSRLILPVPVSPPKAP